MKINYCYNCGSKVDDSAKFCAECGVSNTETDMKKESISNENQYFNTAKDFFSDVYKKNKKAYENANIDITTKQGIRELLQSIKMKMKSNKIVTSFAIVALLLISLFILSPSAENVADKFIEYSAYDQREKALPLMSDEGKDFMMDMSREEFESNPDYSPYEEVLRTRISRLTHNRASQFRELVSYELISEEEFDNEVVFFYQTIFSNGDTETPWIHLVKERGRWKVYSFFENSNYF